MQKFVEETFDISAGYQLTCLINIAFREDGAIEWTSFRLVALEKDRLRERPVFSKIADEANGGYLTIMGKGAVIEDQRPVVVISGTMKGLKPETSPADKLPR